MLESRTSKQLLLMLGDLVVLAAMLFSSLAARTGGMPSAEEIAIHYYHFTPTFAGWLLVMYIAGLYSPELAFGLDSKVVRILGSSFVSVLATAVMFYLMSSVPITPKTLLAIFGTFASVGLILWRGLAAYIGRNFLARSAIVFVGWSNTADDLCRTLSDEPHRGFDIAGAYPQPGFDSALPKGCATIDLMGLSEAAVNRKNVLFIIGDEASLPENVRLSLFELLGKPVRFMRLDDFYERIYRRVPIGIIDVLWFLENVDLLSKRSYQPFKRGLDILVALTGLFVSLPIWPFIFLAIKLSSRGPVFFKQRRLGRNGRLFTLLKFRTMRTDQNDFAPTEHGDPRITLAGKFLRGSRLDELPQLLNILRGDMSFIGPRPERPELAEDLSRQIPFYYQRLLVKPGLTGWDQVSGEYHSASVDDTHKKLQYDLYYLKNMSPLLDLSIFLKTIMTVLMRIGR